MKENYIDWARENLEEEIKFIQGFGGETLWKKISADRRYYLMNRKEIGWYDVENFI